MSTNATKQENKYRFDQASLLSISKKFPKREVLDKTRGWAGILEILSIEHYCILALLDALESLAHNLEKGKVPDYYLILDVLDYLNNYASRYHHPLEDEVFRKVLSNNAASSGHVNQLQQEHQSLGALTERLHKDFAALAAGRRANRPELHEKIREYLVSFRKHIKFETNEVFPLAEGEFAPDDWKVIATKIRFVDDPIFGDVRHDKYSRLTRKIEIQHND